MLNIPPKAGIEVYLSKTGCACIRVDDVAAQTEYFAVIPGEYIGKVIAALQQCQREYEAGEYDTFEEKEKDEED